MLSAQNGLNELVIAKRLGAERTMGCFVNAADLRGALFCLFRSLVEDREFLLRGGPGSHCPIKLHVAHIELRFHLL